MCLSGTKVYVRCVEIPGTRNTSGWACSCTGKDGAYSIDNNLTKRQVRPLASKRKSILYYGGDEGGEQMASIYHNIISTVLLNGKSVWRPFGDFFMDQVTGGDAPCRICIWRPSRAEIL